MSRASLTGLITASVACLAAHAASIGPAGASLPFVFAAACLALGLLPSAMFATLGVVFANAVPRWFGALVAGLMMLIWPVGYLVGKLTEKKLVAVKEVHPVVASPPKPSPRYVKPDGFDTANAWKREVVKVDIVDGLVAGTPVILSPAEDRVVFVARQGGAIAAVSRHLTDATQDRMIVLPVMLRALAWSGDGARMIEVDERGALAVLDWTRGEFIALPIPKVDKNRFADLVWWRNDDVMVTFREGVPQVLSLDTLRLMPASEHQTWAKLPEAERLSVFRLADPPPLHSGAKARIALEGDAAGLALVAHDAEALYSRVLLPGLVGAQMSFSNRDGSIVFIVGRERLSILHLGLRATPPLRFVAESREDFPATDAAKAAIKDRSIECLIAPPIINPLNGKTVSGDAEHAKGLARVIAADGKTATVWVAEERAPIRAGDVVMLPRASSPNGGALLSPTWFAVLTKADASQDIPRREIEKPPAVPAPAAAAPAPPSLSPPLETSSPAPRSSAKAEPPPPAKTTAVKTPPPPQSKREEPPPPPLSDEDKVRQLVVRHHDALSRHDLDGVLATCGAITSINGKDQTREDIRATLSGIFSQKSRVLESVNGEIEVRRGQNSRFTASYDFSFEARIPHGDDERGHGHIDMDVLLTSQGPKMVKKTIRVFRAEKVRGK